MQISWLIDAELFDYRDDLVSAIHSEGHRVKLLEVPSPPYRWDDIGCSYRHSIAQEECVLAHGDIELVTRIAVEKRWRPGVFCSVEEFRCSNYQKKLGQYWLNDNCVMLPIRELSAKKEFLFEKFGQGGKLFVRPDSPLKIFTGLLVSYEHFESDLAFIRFHDFSSDEVVVVAAPRKIVSEFRFVAHEDSIVAGSMYAQNGSTSIKSEFPHGALKLAEKVARAGFAPDPIWVIDICQTEEGEYCMLEVGGFSFSDLYATDKTAIVRAASDAAIRAWRDHV